MRSNITIHRGREHLVVAVAGVVDSRTAPQLRRQFLGAIDERQWQHVTVDLSGVKLLRLAGVEPIVAAYWQATNSGSGFGIVAPHHRVRAALTLAHLDWLMPVYGSVREAIEDSDIDVEDNEEFSVAVPPSGLAAAVNRVTAAADRAARVFALPDEN